MPSSSKLPEPEGWATRIDTKITVSLIVVLFFGCVCLLSGYGFVNIGKPIATKYALLFAALFFLSALFGFLTRVSRSHNAKDLSLGSHEGRPALIIRYSLAVSSSFPC